MSHLLTSILSVLADNEDLFVLNLGEIEEIMLQVNVSNFGESAYETELYINHSKSLSYIALDKGVSIYLNEFRLNLSLQNF